ncbi:2,3-bisphosphoglycerate-independent phosphoglycerate mutase [Bythopirellula polymerisocia]|uniref:Cofactor-independent phosphoglycerate mutase n=1 Tax=Bythopirellula polymerisocia TaxID=2528003 RepID=A0A5C6CW66_9BACT|nr:2,3-bisphosphoglycerate-independent phosphoglycerate mutase [Bythopirellula polymerisocia]TWU27777.1 cofactor-independent phosphoglycerate mutase [Bythopirellula polymerisocia]
MDMHQLTRQLQVKNDSKIVMLVADGLGGLPQQPGGLTELETARTPNLDALTKQGVCGGSIPVKPGISPGSGPGHLGLFGYDPLEFLIGRGALEATGIGFELQENDVAIRANFCTLDAAGNITDRRAGRIPTEESAPLAIKLREVSISGVEVFVEPVKEHRFVVVLRGSGLGGDVADTDPQATGVPPLDPRATNPDSEKTAQVAAEFIEQAKKILAGQPKANCCTLRGFSAKPKLPSYDEVYGLRAGAIAVYPMYKGLARLVGMDILGQAQTLDEQMAVLEENWSKYDFFFIHFKYTDSTGEDGNFDAKVKRTEEVDGCVPRILALKPDVFICTGDHSTPSMLASHSWHAVPTLLVAKNCRTDTCEKFGEAECLRGGLGQFEAKYLMPLALANAGRLNKFGA